MKMTERSSYKKSGLLSKSCFLIKDRASSVSTHNERGRERERERERERNRERETEREKHTARESTIVLAHRRGKPALAVCTLA